MCLHAGKATASKVSVRELIFGAPRLLEWIGWNIVKRDHLLGSFCSPFLCLGYPNLKLKGTSALDIALQGWISIKRLE